MFTQNSIAEIKDDANNSIAININYKPENTDPISEPIKLPNYFWINSAKGVLTITEYTVGSMSSMNSIFRGALQWPATGLGAFGGFLFSIDQVHKYVKKEKLKREKIEEKQMKLQVAKQQLAKTIKHVEEKLVPDLESYLQDPAIERQAQVEQQLEEHIINEIKKLKKQMIPCVKTLKTAEENLANKKKESDKLNEKIKTLTSKIAKAKGNIPLLNKYRADSKRFENESKTLAAPIALAEKNLFNAQEEVLKIRIPLDAAEKAKKDIDTRRENGSENNSIATAKQFLKYLNAAKDEMHKVEENKFKPEEYKANVKDIFKAVVLGAAVGCVSGLSYGSFEDNEADDANTLAAMITQGVGYAIMGGFVAFYNGKKNDYYEQYENHSDSQCAKIKELTDKINDKIPFLQLYLKNYTASKSYNKTNDNNNANLIAIAPQNPQKNESELVISDSKDEKENAPAQENTNSIASWNSVKSWARFFCSKTKANNHVTEFKEDKSCDNPITITVTETAAAPSANYTTTAIVTPAIASPTSELPGTVSSSNDDNNINNPKNNFATTSPTESPKEIISPVNSANSKMPPRRLSPLVTGNLNAAKNSGNNKIKNPTKLHKSTRALK